MSTSKVEGKVLQYLYEAQTGEQAQAQMLTAHIAMTPSGPYRRILERHRQETRGHAARVTARLRQIERHRAIVDLAIDAGRFGIGIVQGVAGRIVATAYAPLHLLRGGISGEEKLLKNAKDECAAEALEIATYDAIEQLAERVGDDETARLASSIRADEERFLARLRAQIPSLTEAVVAAELGRGSYRVATTGAAQVVRRAGRKATRRTRRSGSALERAGRELGSAATAAGVEAASTTETIGSEARQGVKRTTRELTRGAGRTAARAREAAAGAGSTRSGAASQRPAGSRTAGAGTAAAREPWPGYDEQRVDQIAGRIGRDDQRAAEQVREYEARHKDRAGVIQAADRQARRDHDDADVQSLEDSAKR